MPKLAQQILTQANIQIVEGKWTRTPRSTDAQKIESSLFPRR